MLGFFPLRKFGITALIFGLTLIILKWSVDSCLPRADVRRLLAIIPSPEFVCQPIRSWDNWSRAVDTRATLRSSIYRGAPGLLETDDGQPAFLLFSKDLIKLPLLLGKIPGDRVALSQLLFALFLLSFFSAVIWQWYEQLKQTAPPKEVELTPRHVKKPPPAAATEILSGFTNKPRDRR